MLGGVIDPHAAYLILRGVKTLALRVERANANAIAIARYLEQHPQDRARALPGPARATAITRSRARQMSGFGGVVSFEVRGSLETASKFIDALRIPYIAPSLGGVESLVEQPTVVSYWDKTPERARRARHPRQPGALLVRHRGRRRPDPRHRAGAR